MWKRLYSSDALLQRLKADLKAAMISKQETRKTVIRSVLSDYTYATKNAQSADVSLDTLLYKAVKKRQESIRAYQQANRDDLVQSEQEEVDILSAYMPPPMPVEELQRTLDALSDGRSMGEIMKALPPNADKAVAARLLRKQ
jgi:hypothetical protein